MKVLLDTSVLIDLYRNRRKAEAYLQHLGASQRYKAAAQKELQNYTILPIDAAAHKSVYQLARLIELAPGRAADTIIAASAKAHHIKIVTTNVRDFRRLPDVEIIEYKMDW